MREPLSQALYHCPGRELSPEAFTTRNPPARCLLAHTSQPSAGSALCSAQHSPVQAASVAARAVASEQQWRRWRQFPISVRAISPWLELSLQARPEISADSLQYTQTGTFLSYVLGFEAFLTFHLFARLSRLFFIINDKRPLPPCTCVQDWNEFNVGLS